ncbi:hypothetical protein LIT25_01680 [Bacillus sp. F19]|nr:hypothetical protein LIT25_01680 [Bacillus sp. F19]
MARNRVIFSKDFGNERNEVRSENLQLPEFNVPQSEVINESISQESSEEIKIEDTTDVKSIND